MLDENQQPKRNSTKMERVLSPHVLRLATAGKCLSISYRVDFQQQLHMET